MSRDKQNEEMAQCLCGWNRGTLCILDDKDCNLQCTYGKLANELTAKGYRKSTDLAEEIFAEIEKLLKENQFTLLPPYRSEITDWKTVFRLKLASDIAELKKKYIGKDTNVTTNKEEGK